MMTLKYILNVVLLAITLGRTTAQYYPDFITDPNKIEFKHTALQLGYNGPVSTIEIKEYDLKEGNKRELHRNSQFSSTKYSFQRDGKLTKHAFFHVHEPAKVLDPGIMMEDHYTYDSTGLKSVIREKLAIMNWPDNWDYRPPMEDKIIYQDSIISDKFKKIRALPYEYFIEGNEINKIRLYHWIYEPEILLNEYIFKNRILQCMNAENGKEYDIFYYDKKGNNHLIVSKKSYHEKEDSTLITYDKLNRPIKKEKIRQEITTIKYTMNNGELTVTENTIPEKGSYSNTSFKENTYNQPGQLIISKDKYSKNPLFITYYSYNVDSSLKTMYKEVDGDTAQFTQYNEHGIILSHDRHINTWYGKELKHSVEKTVYIYNDQGLLIKRTREEDGPSWYKELIIYTYDKYNNLVEESNTMTTYRSPAETIIRVTDIVYYE